MVAELGPPWPWHGEVEQRVHLTDGSLTLKAMSHDRRIHAVGPAVD